MTKLNQVIAVEKGVKSRNHAEMSDLYKAIQKPELFNGFHKTYKKKDDDGEDLPQEKKRVQFVASEVFNTAARSIGELLDVTARKDWANCRARASVIVGDVTIIENAPVTFLLFLEKQLTDFRTFAATIPVLDDAETWHKDENAGLWNSAEIHTHRTKKVQKPIVLYPATPEHPAQTQMVVEDIIAGWWVQVKQSGAMPKPKREQLVERVDALIKAVKEAREAANGIDLTDRPAIGEAIFGYLLPTA